MPANRLPARASRDGDARDVVVPHFSITPQTGRAAEIVRAAYLLLAERGFEGLRTREVAARVGINSATLHYYFPDKEALIRGVVAHLLHELQTSRVASAAPASALDRLRAEFADIGARLREAPDQRVVLAELAVRAGRDPAIGRMLEALNAGWHGHLAGILRAGVAEGAFRADLDVDATAQAIMTQLWGLVLRGSVGARALDRLVTQFSAQTEHWVRTPPRPDP